MSEQLAGTSPRMKAKIAGVFYLITFIAGGVALSVHGRLGFVAGLIAGACYIAVTLLFYYIFKPVNRRLSLFAALVSLFGCAIGPVSLFVHGLSRINPLVFFGFYCLMIGYLIFRSTFLPRILALLMVIAGLGWLTFLSAPLARFLSPYIFVPGLVGEGVLTVWLLAAGVNVQRWKEQASEPRINRQKVGSA